MREIDIQKLKETLIRLIGEAGFDLNEEVTKRLQLASMQEASPEGRMILREIQENAERARQERLPLCQDCGVTVVFLDIGQEVHFTGGDLRESIDQGVREAYAKFYLRKSIVGDPLTRVNTGDNTPAIIHTEIVPGNTVRIQVMLKGGGCENMSYTRMLPPAAGLAGIKKFVLESVSASGANPCPPIIVGIGIGGNFEYAALLAKKALLREPGSSNPEQELDNLEKDLLALINRLGIGPQGMGGTTTALGVQILKAPCHIASLPVAINIECHSHRHKEATL